MQNQAEYRDNAMRDRHQTGDWMSGNPPSSNVGPRAAAAGIRSSPVKKLSQESEAWFEYNPSSTERNGKSSTTGPARLDGNQNWYRHDGPRKQRDIHPIGVSEPKVKPRRVSDERRAAAGNQSEWFRHDHKTPPAPGTDRSSPGQGGGSRKPPPGRAADEALWFAHCDGQEPNDSVTSPTSASKGRHSGEAAEQYYQRDKLGSGANWFPHEHEPSSAGGGTEDLDHVSGTRGGASRMNLESPAWFSHDNPPSVTSPRSNASPEVQKMQARASGDEVRQILRVNENLRQQQQQQQPSTPSEHPVGNGVGDGTPSAVELPRGGESD